MTSSPRDLNDDDLGHVSGGAGTAAGLASGSNASGASDIEQMFVQAMIDRGLVPANAADKPLSDVTKMLGAGGTGGDVATLMTMMTNLGQTMRSDARDDRTSSLAAQVDAMKGAAANMQVAAQDRFTQATTQAVMQVVGGAVGIAGAGGSGAPGAGLPKTGALDGMMKTLGDTTSGKIAPSQGATQPVGDALGAAAGALQSTLDAKAGITRGANNATTATTTPADVQQHMQAIIDDVMKALSDIKDAQNSAYQHTITRVP